MDAKLCILLLAFPTLFGSKLFAQDSTNTHFFPYKTGDFWVYEEYDQSKQEIVNEKKYQVYADSMDSSGTRWVYIETDDNSRKDSVYYKVRDNGDVYSTEYVDTELLVLKLEETGLDEDWVGRGQPVHEEFYAVFVLKYIGERPLFGASRKQRLIGLVNAKDTSFVAGGIDVSEDNWMEGFGVTARGGNEGGNIWYMKGAWKGGTVYGDTTFNRIVVDTLRTDFFPYRTGDFWVYDIIRNFGNPTTEKVKYRAYADSMDGEGTRWVSVEKNINGAIDSVYYKITEDGDVYSDDLVDTEMLKFKLNGVAKNDYWVGGELENGNYGVYEVRNIGIQDIVDTYQFVSEERSINFYEMQDTLNCCATEKLREYWVAGFGVTSVTYFEKPNAVYWGARGIYKNGQVYGDTTFAVITSNEPEQEAPNAFNLRQNYPNPFNPSTNIQFELPFNSTVSLLVYDVLGREVATLVNGNFPAGKHTIRFDASTLANGMYLYKLRVDNQEIVRKMTLIK